MWQLLVMRNSLLVCFWMRQKSHLLLLSSLRRSQPKWYLKSLWKRVQKPCNLSHLPLNNCKFPLGPMGEDLTVPLPPYLSPPYFSMLSGSLSTQPPACSQKGLWGSKAPGSAIVQAWEESPARAPSKRQGILKKKKKKLSHCFIKRQPLTSKHIRNSSLSEAVISNLETIPPQDAHLYIFNLVRGLTFT